jgi:hypothetical protein
VWSYGCGWPRRAKRSWIAMRSSKPIRRVERAGHARARRVPDDRGRATSLRRRPRPAVRTVPAPARTGVFTERTVRARTVARRRNGRAAALVAEVAVVERVDEARAPLAPLAILAAGPLAPAVAVAEVRADEGAAALPEVRAAEVRAVVVRVDEVFADEVLAGVARVDEVLAGVVLAELRAGAAVAEVRAGEVRDDEARAPLAPLSVPAVAAIPAAAAVAEVRARLGVRRNPRTIRWVKVSALLSASVQKR